MRDCSCKKAPNGEIIKFDGKCVVPEHRGSAAKRKRVLRAGHDRGSILSERPTEVASGLAIAAAVYGFLTQSGVREEVAALIAVALAFGPLVVSNTVDRIRGES